MSSPATTTDAFVELVRKSGLIPASKLDSYLQEHDLPEQPGKLAARLIREGLLTRFQAEQLLRGKHKGFSIGKYRILEKLGVGGMGTVLLCEHMAMNRRVAIKVLPLAHAEDPSILERFHREARAGGVLNHPNIVRTLDLDSCGNLHFLVMEYIDGVSLQQLVEEQGPMELHRACQYISQAAQGLLHAHQSGVVHRDIKPSNLLLDHQGTVKILDMGLARFFNDRADNLTHKYDDKSTLGTADYIAPEQALNIRNADIRADIYSLGATFYFLLTGGPPFKGGTVTQKLIWHQMRAVRPIQERRPGVPHDLAALVERMMAKNASDRFQTPAEVLEALTPWLSAVTPLSPITTTPSSCVSFQLPEVSDTDPSMCGDTRATPQAVPEPPTVKSERPAGDSASKNGALDSDPVIVATGSSCLIPASPSQSIDVTLVRLGQQLRQPPFHWLLMGAVLAGLLVAAVGWIVGSRWLQPAAPPVETAFVQTPATTPETKPSVSPDPVGPPAPRAPQRLIVTRSGETQTYRTIQEALGQARPGDRLIVKDDTWEEVLVLDGKDGLGKDVTIEGLNMSGQPVVWHAYANRANHPPLVQLADVEGLRLTGFVFDGQNRVADLLHVSGACPGLSLDHLHLTGFQGQGARLEQCAGTAERPIVFHNLRVTPASDGGVGLHLAAPSGNVNRHIQVTDCRFEGPMKAAIELAGPVTGMEVRHNRFYRGTDAILIHGTTPAPFLDLSVTANTFYDWQKGLRLEGMAQAGGGSRLEIRGNLFLKVERLASVDKVVTQPKIVKAEWIWLDEGRPGAVPAEERFFRKTFEIPEGEIKQSFLDIACDDSYVIWVNGVQAGRSPQAHFCRRVYRHGINLRLQPGKNVVAVKASNLLDPATGRQTWAGLLAQIRVTTSEGKPLALDSDKTWKACATGPAGWNRTDFDDSGWTQAAVLGAYNAKELPWQNLVWDMSWRASLRTSYPNNTPLTPEAVGNIRDNASGESYPCLDARSGSFTVPTDPANDQTFLRYLKTSPLTKVGSPGVPPRE